MSLTHRPLAKLAAVIDLVPRQRSTAAMPDGHMGVLHAVAFGGEKPVRRNRKQAPAKPERRSSSQDIRSVYLEEVRRGTGRKVLVP